MSALLKSLSAEERSKFKKLKMAASVACQPDVARIKAKYKKLKVAELVASGVDEDAAIKTVKSRLERILLPDDILNFGNAGQVTVKEVLDDPDKYNEQSLADPLEPEKGKCKAKFYANKTASNPVIHSYIHGGTTYKLMGSIYQLFSQQHASGMIKGKFRIARKENNKLTFVAKGDLINHYAGISTDGS